MKKLGTLELILIFVIIVSMLTGVYVAHERDQQNKMANSTVEQPADQIRL